MGVCVRVMVIDYRQVFAVARKYCLSLCICSMTLLDYYL